MMDLSAALDKYYEKFGENYPLCISACREDAEIIAEIEECITTGRKLNMQIILIIERYCRGELFRYSVQFFSKPI